MNFDEKEIKIEPWKNFIFDIIAPWWRDDQMSMPQFIAAAEMFLILAKNTTGLERAAWLRCTRELYLHFPVGMLHSQACKRFDEDVVFFVTKIPYMGLKQTE